MRNTSKMTTLENRFPLLAVEHGCIISKDADITVAFEVELPELYTVTGAEYEARLLFKQEIVVKEENSCFIVRLPLI